MKVRSVIKTAIGGTLLSIVVILGIGAVWGQGHGVTPGDPASDMKGVQKDLGAMSKGAARVAAMQKQAQRKKDIVKASCVQEKLVRIRNIIAMAREQFSRFLMEKMSGNKGAIPLRQQIGLFKERSDDLVAEAERCAGETVKIERKTSVTETVDPSVPQDDPTEPMESIWVNPRPAEDSPNF